MIVWEVAGEATLALRVADLAPTDVGRNVTVIVQPAPAARVTGQLFVSENCPAPVPEIVKLVKVSAADPVLDRATVLAPFVLSLTVPNATLTGATVRIPAGTLPVRLTV